MFYIALTNLGENINIAYDNLFQDYEYPGITSSTTEMNKFSTFVSGICLKDGDIATAIGSSGSRVSRVSSNISTGMASVQ